MIHRARYIPLLYRTTHSEVSEWSLCDVQDWNDACSEGRGGAGDQVERWESFGEAGCFCKCLSSGMLEALGIFSEVLDMAVKYCVDRRPLRLGTDTASLKSTHCLVRPIAT